MALERVPKLRASDGTEFDLTEERDALLYEIGLNSRKTIEAFLEKHYANQPKNKRSEYGGLLLKWEQEKVLHRMDSGTVQTQPENEVE